MTVTILIFSYVWEKNAVRYNKHNPGLRWTGVGGTFEIIEARKMDAGAYQCFASNRYGTAMSQIANMTAAGKPSSSLAIIFASNQF